MSDMAASLIKPDICVVGATPGGLSLAAAAAAFGVSVVLVAQGQASQGQASQVKAAGGGMASEALKAAAEHANIMRNAHLSGFARVTPQINPARLREHVRQSASACAPDDSLVRYAALGVQVIKADARFLDWRTLEAGGQLIHARRFVIAIGSTPEIPAIPGLDTLDFLTSETILGLNKTPDHLIVLGGGAVGAEIAQAHARLGTRVTLVMTASLLQAQDPEAVGFVRRALIRDGVRLIEGAKVVRAQAQGRSGVALVLADTGAGEAGSGEEIIAGSHLLVATGHQASLAVLDCAAAGIHTDAQGIVVNDGLRSSNSRVFAIGDCASGAVIRKSTHAALHHARLVLRSALFRASTTLDTTLVPDIVSTVPEIASVGLSETQARACHRGVQTLRSSLAGNARGRALQASEGMVKVMADRKGRILGVVIVAPHASELVTPWTLALAKGLNLKDMAGVVMPVPSLSQMSHHAAVSAFTPLARSPSVRRLITFLRRFG